MPMAQKQTLGVLTHPHLDTPEALKGGASKLCFSGGENKGRERLWDMKEQMSTKKQPGELGWKIVVKEEQKRTM